MGGQGNFTTGGARSNPDPTKLIRDVPSGKDVRTSIGVLGEYTNPLNPKQNVTPLEALYTALHEIGHGLEGGFIPGTRKGTKARRNSFYRRLSDGDLTRTDKLYLDTFRSAIAELMDAAAGDTSSNTRPETFVGSDQARRILDEIVRQQRIGVLAENTPVRPTYESFKDAFEEAARVNPGVRPQLKRRLERMENDYFQTPHELAADLIGLYLMNPKKAKAEMPEATRLVRDILNKGDVVKFYSMPLAAMVAAIFANMLVAEGEDDEMQGLLSLGQGALSA